jgi:integrase
LRRAEAEARKIAALLDCKEFKWPENSAPEIPPESASSAIERFREEYLARGGKPSTWDSEYWRCLKKLIQPPTPESLIALVKVSPPNTRTRLRFCNAVACFARFLGIQIDVSPYRGNYSSFSSISARELPTDEQILAAYKLLPEKWRWVYGAMATYGLRNHEVFRVDLSLFPTVQVGENSKTGAREVWPCPANWADHFNLQRQILPNCNLELPNASLGHRVTVVFRRAKVPFSPYDLRHAFAVRTMTLGYPDSLAAQMMGHSLQVHSQIYHKWLSRRTKQQVFERLNQPR